MILYFRFLFDNKIHTLDDIESVINAPVLGDIPSTKSDNMIIINKDDKSNIAESFRLLRTNVNFMLSGVNMESKSIFITSTLENEGKTFIAINLASSLSLLNKKVLLIGADIRKPKISKYLNIDSDSGLTNYLIDNSLQVPDIIEYNTAGNFDVITSGPIPPNPSELLTNGRFEDVLTFGNKNYDYIVVDTAPVNIVADTLLFGHLADLFIYVIRANHLDKRMLKIPKTMYENKRLPNMAILINDTNYVKRGYNYGYYHKEPKDKISWLKKKYYSIY